MRNRMGGSLTVAKDYAYVAAVRTRATWGTRLGVGLMLGLVGAGLGQGADVEKNKGLKTTSRAEYETDLTRMGALVAACRAQASACDVKAVPSDETVPEEGDSAEFRVRWEWLRVALRTGSGVKDPDAKADDFDFGLKPDRTVVLDAAAARLREDLAEVRGDAPTETDAGAKAKVDEVLARREFGQVQKANWWQLAMAKVSSKLQDWWGEMAGVVPWAPWVGVLLEWGLLVAAVVGLIVWALRLSKQQRVSFATEREAAPQWQAESDDWAARAKAEAAKGEWREAVHCLYWSAIVMLEGQRLWRQNRARTPREYVGLLEPGSARRRLLGGLTAVFERIWYGIRPATGEDYEKAEKLLEELRVG